MTHTIRFAALTLVLAAATFAPTAALGRTSSNPTTGTIVAVDRDARAVVVLDRATKQTVRVEIPKGAQVAISEVRSKGTAVEFEQVLVGMQYRGIR